MKTKITAIACIFLALAGQSFAQGTGGALSQNGPAVSLSSQDEATGHVSVVVPNPSASFKVVTDEVERLAVSGTGNLSFLPYTVTPAATPVATTNAFHGVVNVIPTAAANTAALLPVIPSPGTLRLISNTGPNAVRVKAGGTDTINGSAAGAYIPLAALTNAHCVATSATNWQCHTGTVPTPAGP